MHNSYNVIDQKSEIGSGNGIDAFYKQGLTKVITTSIKSGMKLSNSNGATFKVWEWVSNSISLFTGQVFTHKCWG